MGVGTGPHVGVTCVLVVGLVGWAVVPFSVGLCVEVGVKVLPVVGPTVVELVVGSVVLPVVPFQIGNTVDWYARLLVLW